jgi:hypothetical protein
LDDTDTADAGGSELPPVESGAQLLAANYSRLSEEAQYRDDLLVKANYFSLAIIAALGTVFFEVITELRPLVAMAGAMTGYSFWLATESYKGARDELNKSMKEHERTYEQLSVTTDYDTRDRSPIGKRSLSSYFVGLQATITALWMVIYVVLVVRLSYF